MNFPAVVSAAGLVNNASSALKSARELAKETSDTALKEQISEAYDALLSLKEHTLALDDENRELKARLKAKNAYAGPVAPHGYYYAADDERQEHPLCPSCYQSEPMRTAFLGKLEAWNGGARRTCKLCGWIIYEETMNRLSKPRAVRLHRS